MLGKDEIDFGHKVYLTVFEQYADMFSPEKMKKLREDFHAVAEYIEDNLTGSSVEGYALRCLSSVVIEYFPEEVLIEDVTDKFVK